MTETSLYDLLQDMLTLQAEVFTCISEDVCHKVLPNLQESKYLETKCGEGQIKKMGANQTEGGREGGSINALSQNHTFSLSVDFALYTHTLLYL